MNNNSVVAGGLAKLIRVALVVVFASPLFLTTAGAQFGSGFGGQSSLPQNDFTWTWGNRNAAGRGLEDFSVLGNDGGFRCDLTGKLRLGSRVSRMDIREIERNIRSSIYFVQAATYAMNDLDARRELDWAMLDCEKPRQSEDDEEE